MKQLKAKVSITLDCDVIEKLRTLAEKEDRSFSQYINIVLVSHLAEKNIEKKDTSYAK